MINIHMPLYNVGTSEQEQYDKVLEEFDELKTELSGGAEDIDRVLHEMFDVIQSIAHLRFVEIRPSCQTDDEAMRKVTELIESANYEHRLKLATYAKERGWQ
jgi:hypothetical protein